MPAKSADRGLILGDWPGKGGERYAEIVSCFSTGDVSGLIPRQILNDSAACSTSIPQPMTDRAAPWRDAHSLNGVGVRPYDMS